MNNKLEQLKKNSEVKEEVKGAEGNVAPVTKENQDPPKKTKKKPNVGGVQKKKKPTRRELEEALHQYNAHCENLEVHNQYLLEQLEDLRDQLQDRESKLSAYASDDPPPPFSRYIEDIRTIEQLKAYIRDGFKDDTNLDMRKVTSTYQINYALTNEQFINITNTLEKEIRATETKEFLAERKKWLDNREKSPQKEG